MEKPQKQPNWHDRLLYLLDLFSTGRLVLLLRNVLDVWDLFSELRGRIGYHGMYEIVDYDSTLEILNPKGEKAKLVRHEVIRLLQDNVVAIHDHAWGDGELFAEYRCQPGVPVDFYKDGSKHNVLISLRETKNRGDVIDLWIERVIRDGFPAKNEWLETEIDHWMAHLKLSIIFPRQRRCRRATVTQRSTNDTITLDEQHFSFLSDGRQQLTWENSRPKLHDLYTIKWRW